MVDSPVKDKASRNVVQLTKELVKIPSENPPGDQKPIAEFLESRMKAIGLKVVRYDFDRNKPNVVGKLAGRRDTPVLMFNGHVDTVPAGEVDKWQFDPFGAVEHEGKLYGRGSADMKGGLASMICAAESIVESGLDLNGSLLLTCVVDEELTGFGTRDIVEKGYRADFAVVGEPTNLTVQTAHKGALEFNVRTRGISVHASQPRRGVNAVYKMSKVCLALEKYLGELEKIEHPLVGKASISVGRIEGGTARNVVPESCEIWVERRVLPNEDFDNVKLDLQEVFKRLQDEDRDLRLEWNITLEVDAAETPSNSLIVKKATEAVSEVTGKPREVRGFTATSDMRFLVNQAKIPTIILGPGGLEQAHVTDEFIEVRQLIDSTRIYCNIAQKLLE